MRWLWMCVVADDGGFEVVIITHLHSVLDACVMAGHSADGADVQVSDRFFPFVVLLPTPVCSC